MDEKELNLKISASPHVRSDATTADIMSDVMIALVPATAFGVYLFGMHAALLVLACVVSAVLAEFIYEKMFGFSINNNNGLLLFCLFDVFCFSGRRRLLRSGRYRDIFCYKFV